MGRFLGLQSDPETAVGCFDSPFERSLDGSLSSAANYRCVVTAAMFEMLGSDRM